MQRLFWPLDTNAFIQRYQSCGLYCAFESFWIEQGHWVCLLIFAVALLIYAHPRFRRVPLEILALTAVMFFLPAMLAVVAAAVSPVCGNEDSWLRRAMDYSFIGLLAVQVLSVTPIIVMARGGRFLAFAFAGATVFLGLWFSWIVWFLLNFGDCAP